MNAVRNYQKELDKILTKLPPGQAEGVKVDIAETGRVKTADAGDGGEICPRPPRLFLHSCCAPCSSYVLEYLRVYFKITVFYYNPNITEAEEYHKRVAEQKRLIAAYNGALQKSGAARGGESQETERNGAAVMQCGGKARCGNEACFGERKQSPQTGYHIDVVEGDYEPDRFFEMARGLEKCPEGGERCFACYELRLRETAKHAKAGAYDYFTTTLSISPLKNAAKLNEIGERLAEEYGVKWLPSDFKKRDGYRRSIELSKEYGLYRQDYCGCVYSRRQA